MTVFVPWDSDTKKCDFFFTRRLMTRCENLFALEKSSHESVMSFPNDVQPPIHLLFQSRDALRFLVVLLYPLKDGDRGANIVFGLRRGCLLRQPRAQGEQVLLITTIVPVVSNNQREPSAWHRCSYAVVRLGLCKLLIFSCCHVVLLDHDTVESERTALPRDSYRPEHGGRRGSKT